MVEATRLLKIAEAISLLPSGATFNEAEFELTGVQEIMDRMEVTSLEFHLLDETPGRLGYNLGNDRDWHWKLRSWRNSLAGCHRFADNLDWPRCKNCGAFKVRNPETNRLRCPAVDAHIPRSTS